MLSASVADSRRGEGASARWAGSGVIHVCSHRSMGPSAGHTHATPVPARLPPAEVRGQGVSRGMVSNTMMRAQTAGLRTWAEVEALSDEALEERLYGPARAARKSDRPPPDPV